jgi:hypothetical protein
MVEVIRRNHAIYPIRLAFGSDDLTYFTAGHLVIKRKQSDGSMRLKRYIPNCVKKDVESGADANVLPQLGQK